MQNSAGSSGLSRLNGLGDRHPGHDAHGECEAEGIPPPTVSTVAIFSTGYPAA